MIRKVILTLQVDSIFTRISEDGPTCQFLDPAALIKRFLPLPFSLIQCHYSPRRGFWMSSCTTVAPGRNQPSSPPLITASQHTLVSICIQVSCLRASFYRTSYKMQSLAGRSARTSDQERCEQWTVHCDKCLKWRGIQHVMLFHLQKYAFTHIHVLILPLLILIIFIIRS